MTAAEYAIAEIKQQRFPNIRIEAWDRYFVFTDPSGEPFTGTASFTSREAAEKNRSALLDRANKCIGRTA